jgi:hypothetical protein
MDRIFGYNTITFKDDLYIVKAAIRESHNPNLDTWKDYLGCSIILKNNGIYYFCELIPEAEIINEEIENKPIISNEEIK